MFLEGMVGEILTESKNHMSHWVKTETIKFKSNIHFYMYHEHLLSLDSMHYSLTQHYLELIRAFPQDQLRKKLKENLF